VLFKAFDMFIAVIGMKFQLHGMANTVSWGIMMPVGVMIARYAKVCKFEDPAWFKIHVVCQSSAYVVGVAGWATGMKLGSDSTWVEYRGHRILGILIFILGTFQVPKRSFF
jgi:hypothetical protein